MANKFIIRNGYVQINGTDCTSLIQSVSVEMTSDQVDVTALGAGAHQFLPGLRTDQFVMNAYSDFTATTGLNAVLWPLFSTNATFSINVAPFTSTVGTANPFFNGTVSLFGYNPVSGAVGAAAMTPLTFMAVSGTFTMATS